MAHDGTSVPDRERSSRPEISILTGLGQEGTKGTMLRSVIVMVFLVYGYGVDWPMSLLTHPARRICIGEASPIWVLGNGRMVETSFISVSCAMQISVAWTVTVAAPYARRPFNPSYFSAQVAILSVVLSVGLMIVIPKLYVLQGSIAAPAATVTISLPSACVNAPVDPKTEAENPDRAIMGSSRESVGTEFRLEFLLAFKPEIVSVVPASSLTSGESAKASKL